MSTMVFVGVASVATLIALPTIVAPIVATRLANRAHRLSVRFDAEALNHGVFMEEGCTWMTTALANLPGVILATSATPISLESAARIPEDPTPLLEFLKSNEWAQTYVNKAFSLYVIARFFGNPYDMSHWKLTIFALFMLYLTTSGKSIRESYTADASSEFARIKDTGDWRSAAASH